MKKRFMVFSLFMAVLMLGGCALIPGQGQVTGTVTDSFFNPIENATVEIEGLSTTTDAKGAFSIAEVPTGAKSLTVSATGYATKTVSVQVEKDTASTVEVLLEQIETDPARELVSDFKNSMYRLGTIYLEEESMVNEYVEKEWTPFVTEITPHMENANIGLLHAGVYFNIPGTYEYVYDARLNVYKYVQQYPGDMEAETLTWIVNDKVNNVTVTLTAPNMSTYWNDQDLTNIIIDLTGKSLNYVVTSNEYPDAVYEASFVVSDTNTRTVTYVDGITTYSVVLPTGPTATLTAKVDPDLATTGNEVTIDGLFDMPEQEDAISLVFNGSVSTPHSSFSGGLVITSQGVADPVSMDKVLTLSADGEFTSGSYVIRGEFAMEFSVAEVMFFEYPKSGQLSGSYKSDTVTFEGSMAMQLTNYQEMIGSFADPIAEYTVNGSLTYTDGDQYAIDAKIIEDDANNLHTITYALERNGLTFEGNLTLENEILAALKITNEAQTILEVDLSKADKVGTIIGADGTVYANIDHVVDDVLGEGLMIQYNNNTFEFLPLDPMTYISSTDV